MKSSVGEFELEVPRARNGTFEPQIVKKHQKDIILTPSPTAQCIMQIL